MEFRRVLFRSEVKFAIASRRKMGHLNRTARGFSPIVHLDPGASGAALHESFLVFFVSRMLTRSPSIFTENGAVRPRRTAEFTGIQVAVLFAALTLVASIPIITHPLPPLSDYINHLARMHVIAAIGRDADLARFYQIDWQIIPNLMMDVLVPRLTAFMTVY